MPTCKKLEKGEQNVECTLIGATEKFTGEREREINSAGEIAKPKHVKGNIRGAENGTVYDSNTHALELGFESDNNIRQLHNGRVFADNKNFGLQRLTMARTRNTWEVE